MNNHNPRKNPAPFKLAIPRCRKCGRFTMLHKGHRVCVHCD